MLRLGAAVSCVLLAGAPGAAVCAAGRGPLALRVNGIEFAVQSRVLDGDPGDLARRLEGRWGERLPDVPAGAGASVARRLLGRQRGAFHETLTLSAGPRAGTALAVVAVQDLRRAPSMAASLPMALPAGASLLNVVEFGRGRVTPSLFTLETRAAPESALATLAASARASGWRRTASSGAGPGSRALWARRGRDELTAVAVASGARTRLVLLVAPAAGGSHR